MSIVFKVNDPDYDHLVHNECSHYDEKDFSKVKVDMYKGNQFFFATISEPFKRIESYKYIELDFKNIHKKFKHAPREEEEFLKDISQYQLISLDSASKNSAKDLILNQAEMDSSGQSNLKYHIERTDLLTKKVDHLFASLRNIKRGDTFYKVLYEPKPDPFSKVISHKGVSYKLSDEIIAGMAGERGEDHSVSKDLINDCVKIKHNEILSNLKEPKKAQRFDLYFFEKDRKQVLNVVFDYYPANQNMMKQINVLTAYFPKAHVLRYRTGLSNIDHWVGKLPCVPKTKKRNLNEKA